MTGNQASSLIEYESPQKKDYNYTPENKNGNDVRFDIDYDDNFYHTNQRFDQHKNSIKDREPRHERRLKSTLPTVRDDMKQSNRFSKESLPKDKNKANVKQIKNNNDKNLLDLAKRLNSNKGNLWLEKFNATDFTEKIKNISKMIDYMARENSKTRRTRRSQVRSVAK